MRARFSQLLLLGASTWAVAYARFTLGPLQEALQQDLALSDNQIAWLQGPAIAVPMALAAIPMGLLVYRYSRVRLFLFFAVLNLGAIVLTAVASTLAALIVARCLTGLSLAAILVAAYSVVADLYPPAQRGRATMVLAIGEVSAPPAAFALGGMLLAIAGVALDSWRWALLWMCVPLVLAALLMSAFREPPRTAVVVKNPPLREVWPEFWSYRVLIAPLLIARIMVWIADGAVLVWGAPIFARTFALSPERIGAIMGVVLLASGVLGPLLGGPLADLCQRTGGPRRTMTALAVLMLATVPAALFALMPSATLASIVLTIFLTLGFTIGTAAIALGTIVIPGELRGLFVAVQITVGALSAIGLAPLMVSGLSGALGGPTMIGKALAVVCAAASVLGAIVFGFGRRNFPINRERA